MKKYKITGVPNFSKGGNMYSYKTQFNPYNTLLENGGSLEIDIPEEDIQKYLNNGYNVEQLGQFSNGGIFRRRKRNESMQPGSWAGVTPELVQPGEDPFALPTNTPLPEAEFVQPTLTEEEIAELQRQEKLNAKISGYKPKELKYKDLSRPKAQFVPSENMSNELLKTLNDSGFYTNKTKDGDYEVFTNKDIADLIYKKGINPNELSTKFDIGNSKELKKHFEPVYQNADLIHAKRNKEKIDKLIAQGYDKESAIAKLVRDGEGIKEGLEKHYGSYTQAAFDKNKAEVEALTSLGVANIDKLTPYQRQMYLNVKKSADDAYKKDVISAQDNVASWNPYEIQPAESTAVRNKVGAVNPSTGEYEQADNRTAYEKNKDNIFKAEQALDKYNKTIGVQTDLANKILSAPNLTDADRKKFLENPDEFNKLYQSFVNWKNAPEGSGGSYIQASGLTGQNTFKTPFEITPEGAVWTPGTNRTNAPSGRVDMLDKEWITGVLGGLAFKPVMGGVGAVLDYAPVAAAPWATAGNALNAYMGYETFKPEGLIDKSIEGFEKGDKVQGWTNTAEASLNLLPFLGPLAKGVKALKDLNTVDKAADAENLVQAGFFGDLKKGFIGESKDALVNKDMLKQFEASNYENVPEDLLAQLAAKRKATLNKGILSSSGLSPEEALVFSKNKDKINDLMANIPDAAPVSTVTAPKSGIKSWYEGVKQDFKKGWQGDNTKKSADATQNVTQSTQNVAQSTGKYMTEEELAQQMYGSNYNDLTSLSKSQVDKAFKAQPLPSGASTSTTGAGSTVTNVSDDIILKNKIAQQKYGSNYDEVSSWAQGAVDKEFQLAKTAQQEAAAASQTGDAVNPTPLKDRIKAQVKPDDAYFDNSFDPNNPYVQARGRTMDYDQTVNMLEELTGKIPVLEDAGFPMYLHGSTSASLPGIIKSGGIEPLGDILNAGEVPFTGELAFGVQGMNQGNTSTAFIRTPNSALDYALGQSGKGKINIEDDLNKWFTQNREKYTAYEGMPQPEFYDDLYNKRLSQWQNLTKEEQALLNENFPVMYGIKPKTAKTVTGEKRFMIPRSDVADEMGIAGKIGMDEIPSIFVPKEQVDALQKMIGDKTKVLPMNQFIKNQRPWQQQRYLDQWKNLGYSIERLGGAIYKNGGSIDIDIDDPKLIDMLIASGYDVEQM